MSLSEAMAEACETLLPEYAYWFEENDVDGPPQFEAFTQLRDMTWGHDPEREHTYVILPWPFGYLDREVIGIQAASLNVIENPDSLLASFNIYEQASGLMASVSPHLGGDIISGRNTQDERWSFTAPLRHPVAASQAGVVLYNTALYILLQTVGLTIISIGYQRFESEIDGLMDAINATWQQIVERLEKLSSEWHFS